MSYYNLLEYDLKCLILKIIFQDEKKSIYKF